MDLIAEGIKFPRALVSAHVIGQGGAADACSIQVLWDWEAAQPARACVTAGGIETAEGGDPSAFGEMASTRCEVADCGIKRMKTKWGHVEPGSRRIWLDLELAKKFPL